jgi:hypothetical protein
MTIARFRVRHEQALAGFLVESLKLCAAETDQREDQLFGNTRGDELPDALASKTSRLARLRQAKARLEAEAAERARRLRPADRRQRRHA